MYNTVGLYYIAVIHYLRGTNGINIWLRTTVNVTYDICLKSWLPWPSFVTKFYEHEVIKKKKLKTSIYLIFHYIEAYDMKSL